MNDSMNRKNANYSYSWIDDGDGVGDAIVSNLIAYMMNTKSASNCNKSKL